MCRRPNPARSRYPTWAPTATPRAATLALVTSLSSASSAPMRHAPKLSPRSALRSISYSCRLNVTVVPGRAWASSGRSASSTTAITGYPPVVGWLARRTSGCPSGGTWTAPSTIPSLGSSPVDVCSSDLPVSRAPIRSDSGETAYVAVVNVVNADRVNRSWRGPSRTPRRTGPAATAGRGLNQNRGRRAARRAEGQRVAVAQDGRPEAGEGVGGAAAQHRLHRDAAGDRQVAAQAGTGRTDLDHRAGPHRYGHAEVGRAGADAQPGDLGPGNRDHGGGVEAQRAAGHRDLQAGRRGRVADEPVREQQRRQVHGAGPRYPQVRVPRPAEVLDGGQRTCAQHLDTHGVVPVRSAQRPTRHTSLTHPPV